ncbi:telomerase Cajal body protein 1 isoform X2 [Periplaneta americana]|uniref:telomerase Cajal body protein 1 isoform X2 n=1 Tax=Periplaneta americana TaxID=6978 RepID=UPI0037E8D257
MPVEYYGKMDNGNEFSEIQHELKSCENMEKICILSVNDFESAETSKHITEVNNSKKEALDSLSLEKDVTNVEYFKTSSPHEEHGTSKENFFEETTAKILPVDSTQELIYSSQEYKFNNVCQITMACKEFEKQDNFMKGCKWAPDGTCILTNSDDNVLRVFDLPADLHCQESWQKSRTLPELEPALRIMEGGCVYDYCWYPLMSSRNPLSCSVDEVEGAYSLAFDPSGEKLYCGFKNVVRIFDTNLPGRQCETRKLKQAHLPSQRQTGIISCISVNPAMPTIYAAGSYDRSLGVYSEPNGTLLCLFLGHAGGLTHLQFSPDGTKLISGGRRHPNMVCWDIRNPGTVLFTVERIVTTNQRMYFDITPDSKYLVSGNTNGCLNVWDMLQTPNRVEQVLPVCSAFQAHQDCVNGISVHQQYPILATASGQRHITSSGCESDDSSIEDICQETSLKLCDGLLALHPAPKLEGHPLLAVHDDCFFNIFTATLHIWRLRTRHAMVTGPTIHEACVFVCV